MRHRRKRQANTRRWLWFLPLLPLLLIPLVWQRAEATLRPIAAAYGENSVKTLATQAINEAVTALLADGRYTDGLVHTTTDASGAVTQLVTDAGRANALQLAATEAVLTRLAQTDIHTVSVPLGTLSGSALLSGRGPRVPVRLSLNHAVETALAEEWCAAGINQSAHTLQLSVTVTMVLALADGEQITQQLTCRYPVAETILVGPVPDAYGGWYKSTG